MWLGMVGDGAIRVHRRLSPASAGVAVEFTSQGTIPAKVALRRFDIGSAFRRDSRPDFLHGLSGVRGWNGDDGVVEVLLGGQDVVGGTGDPSIAHAVVDEVFVRFGVVA